MSSAMRSAGRPRIRCDSESVRRRGYGVGVLATETTEAQGWRSGPLPLEPLEDELCALAAHLNAGVCRWLERVLECEREGDWGRARVALLRALALLALRRLPLGGARVRPRRPQPARAAADPRGLRVRGALLREGAR